MNKLLDEDLVTQWNELPNCRDPYPFYARLRSDAPVWWTPDDQWYVTRYEDVHYILRNPELFASDHVNNSTVKPDPYLADPNNGLFSQVYASILSFQDGNAHRRLRRLMAPVFTPRAVQRLREQVTEAVISQLDLAMAAGNRQMEFKRDFALMVPTRIILDMLGIDYREAYRFYEMTDLIIPPPDKERGSPAEWIAQADATYERHFDFIIDVCTERRAKPNGDLLSSIVRVTEDGDRLGDIELVGMVSFLASAGHETTANTLTNGLYTLLVHPPQLQFLRENSSAVPRAVEEIMRYDAAVRNIAHRFATRDTLLGITTIHRGERVLGSINAANRDPAAFPDPDTFDVTRDPNPHLAFSGGPHTCLGMWLARSELQVSLATILDRMQTVELAGEATWLNSFMIRGLDSLPIRW